MKKLSNKSMSEVQGGVSREEYCGTATMIRDNNPYDVAIHHAWSTHCAAMNPERMIFPDYYQ